MEKDNEKELSDVELKKQGFYEDLKRIRKELEQEVREQANKASGGRGGINRNIANWQLLKFPYGSFKARKNANENHQIAQKVREQKIRDEIAQKFRAKRQQLELNVFGESMAAARAKEKAAADLKTQMQAFKDGQSEKLEAERKKSWFIEQGKIQTNKTVQKRQAPEQDNKKPLAMGADFNAQNEKKRKQMETEATIKAFQERTKKNRIVVPEQDNGPRDKTELKATSSFNEKAESEQTASSDTQEQDKAAKRAAFENSLMADFDRVNNERDHAGHDMER